MELPITEKEFEIIVEALKNREPQLYNKLWSYKFNKDKITYRK
jgi:hypothetical protein